MWGGTRRPDHWWAPLTGGDLVLITVERLAVGAFAVTLAVLVWLGIRRPS